MSQLVGLTVGQVGHEGLRISPAEGRRILMEEQQLYARLDSKETKFRILIQCPRMESDCRVN